jgi:hypothetical protein
MAIPIVATRYEGRVYSPFTGKPAESDDGPNIGEESLLFIYIGGAGEYSLISERLAQSLSGKPDELEPQELAEKIGIEGAFILEVDAGWNGVNSYGFAPPQE